MKRNLLWMSTALVLGAAGALAAADDLPKADTILDKYVEVTGGKAAYAKIHTELGVSYYQLSAAGATDIGEIDSAIDAVSSQRSQFGAVQNRLGYTLENAAIYEENLTASESRIRDVDMASEMVNFTKLQILQQAGTSMLAQANQASQGVLSLLR